MTLDLGANNVFRCLSATAIALDWYQATLAFNAVLDICDTAERVVPLAGLGTADADRSEGAQLAARHASAWRVRGRESAVTGRWSLAVHSE